MSRLLHAAQQALEALETLSKLGNGNSDGNSIGNTIAQEAREHLFTALAQPEQEPVAWRFKDPKDGHWLYTTHIVDLSKEYWRLKNEVFDPLYTTPPQRKPLTDEDLRKLADKHLFYQPEGYEVSGIYNLARAIEAAHNIKERT